MKGKPSSLRVYGSAYVELFPEKQFKGHRVDVMHDVYQMDFHQDNVLSLRVKKRTRNDFVCLYEHPGFRGTPTCAEAGKSVSSLTQFANRASSLFITGNAKAEIFAYPGFDKNHRYTTVTRTTGYLSDIDWDDDIDSFRVLDHAKNSVDFDNTRMTAITEQNRIGSQSLFYRTNWIGSHNSYNSDDYNNHRNQNMANHTITTLLRNLRVR